METETSWPRFLTIAEAARYTSLPKHFWYRMTSSGTAPGLVRFGPREIRIDRLQLEAWIQSQNNGGNGHAEGDPDGGSR